MFSIHLLKNSSTTFETVVSITTDQTPQIQWKDSSLQVRASVTGDIDARRNAYLRLTIDKNSFQCQDDLTMYMCKMSTLNPINITNIGMHCKLILFNEYRYFYLKLNPFVNYYLIFYMYMYICARWA